MSEEMVERVALVIEASMFAVHELPLSAELHAKYLKTALAAIAALREPTEEMLSAGDSMMPQIVPGQDITTGRDALADAWPAMIDAALWGWRSGKDVEPESENVS